MRHMNRILAGLIISGATLAVAGCGDNPELKLQRAKIALSTDKPDAALQLVEAVLKDQPDNAEAVRYKATAQMRLEKLNEAKTTIDALIAKSPDDPASRKLLTEWAFRKLGELMRQSAFPTNAEMQAQFDRVLELGRNEADWLETTGKEVAEARFLRGRFAEADAIRLTAIARDKRADLSNLNPETREPTEAAGEVIRGIEAQSDGQSRLAAEFMRSALEANPRLFEAVEFYTRLLIRQQDWQGLWMLANTTSAEGELPVYVFERLSLGLIRTPDSEHTAAERLEVGRKIQAQVTKEGQQSKEWKVAAARLDLMAREYVQAKAKLDEVLKTAPRDAEARYLTAQSLYGMEKYEEAKETLDKLSTDQPRAAQVQTLHGLTLVKLKQFDLAREALTRATELDPLNPIPREALISLKAEQGAMSQAGTDVEEYYRKQPGDPRAIRLKMGYELSRNRPDAVREVLARVEKISPRTAELMSVLSDGYATLREYPLAERYADELTRERPDSLDAHLRLAQLRIMQDRDAEVRASLTALREKFPNSGGVDQLMGSLYLQRGSFDKAVELLQGVVKKEPSNQEARLLLARGLVSLSLPDEALEQTQAVLDRSPQDVDAHALAARAYQMKGENDKAAEHLQQIDVARVDEATNPTLLAQLKMRQGDLDDAIAVANRAVASGVPDPTLRLLLAEAYRRKENYPQVEANLVALVRSQPRNAAAYEMLARFFVDQKDVERGLAVMVDLQSVNEVLARISQAAMLSATGRREESLLRLEPIYVPLIRQRSKDALVVADAMATTYVVMGDPVKAHAVYNALNAEKLFPADVAMRQLLLTADKDTPDETAAKLEDVVSKLTPEQTRFREPVINRFMSIRRYVRALELIETWQKESPADFRLMALKGNVLAQMGRQEDAVAAYSAAIKMEPESLTLRQMLANAYLRVGDYPGAEKVLKEMEELHAGAKVFSLAMQGRMFLDLGLTRQSAIAFEQLERTGKANDPRVILAMGTAYAAMNQDDVAMQRLAEVPNYAPQYAPAQILLARVEQRRGKIEPARARLEALIRNPVTASLATRELLALSAMNPQDEDLLRWSDQALAIDRLTGQARAGWLNVRITLAANKRDWPAVSKSLEQLAAINKDSPNVAAARSVVALRLRRLEDARKIFDENPSLVNTPGGYLLAYLVKSSAPKQDLPLSDYMIAMTSGDLAAARSAAARIRNRASIFRDDLITLIERPDAASPEMSSAFRDLALALVAAEVGLPQLTGELAQGVIDRMPTVVPAHGLLAQSLGDRGMPADTALANLRRVAPNSAIALLLSGGEKTLKKDYNGALADYEALLKREPDNENLEYLVAQAIQRTGRPADAIPLLRKIHAGKGAYKLAAANDLAYLLATHDPAKMDEAQALALETIKTAPRFIPLIDTVGWIYHLRGDDKAAMAYLNQAITSLRNVPEVHYHMAAVYAKLGNKTWSGYHLREALGNGDKDAPWYAQAKKLGE